MRRRHCHVHAPHLVEKPVVLGVVHPCDDAWNREFLLGELGDDEIVLVIAGDRNDDVHLVEMSRLQGGHLAGIRVHVADPLDFGQ